MTPAEAISAGRRRNMQAVRAKDTKPELLVRRLAHKLGYRFRLHSRDLPGRPDLVFSRRRKIVEVRGCFWHHHPDPNCRNAVLPRTRQDWWAAKLAGNVNRDARNLRALEEMGWEVMIIWECETRDSEALASELAAFLGPVRS